MLMLSIFRPYKETKHNLRQIFNMLCGAIVIGIYTYLSKQGSATGNNFQIYLPYVVLGTLLVVIVVNSTFLAWHLFNKIKSLCSKEKALPFHEECIDDTYNYPPIQQVV